jgi:molybdopterin synthase sulfur carrier subunit
MKLLYFAWVREKAGIGQEEVDLPDGTETVADVIRWLRTRGPEFESAFEKSEVIRAAIDQTHVRHTATVAGATEIAFFPPVTGG